MASGWLLRPSVYAPFAEIPADAPFDEPGFKDTGLLLRAFLPIANQQDRVLIKDYNGPATVIDTRVVCFPPQIKNVEMHTDTGTAELWGNVSDNYWQNTPTSDGWLQDSSLLVDYSADFNSGALNRTTFSCEADIDALMTFCQLKPTMSGSFLVGQLQNYTGNQTGSWVPG